MRQWLQWKCCWQCWLWTQKAGRRGEQTCATAVCHLWKTDEASAPSPRTGTSAWLCTELVEGAVGAEKMVTRAVGMLDVGSTEGSGTGKQRIGRVRRRDVVELKVGMRTVRRYRAQQAQCWNSVTQHCIDIEHGAESTCDGPSGLVLSESTKQQQRFFDPVLASITANSGLRAGRVAILHRLPLGRHVLLRDADAG